MLEMIGKLVKLDRNEGGKGGEEYILTGGGGGGNLNKLVKEHHWKFWRKWKYKNTGLDRIKVKNKKKVGSPW